METWKDGSAINSIGYSSRGPKLSLRTPHGVSQLSAIPVSGNLMLSFELLGYDIYVVHRCTHMQTNTHTHAKKKRKGK